MPSVEVATPSGPARARLAVPARPRALALLGHGAGGGVDTPDLLAVHDRLLREGLAVALVEQPYRVAGRRAPAPAPRLDDAWVAVAEALGTRPGLRGLPVVAGGRSSGARVACRTAERVGAAAVVALAFPLHPPGRPQTSRLSELLGCVVPVLVVQGERDAFGRPGDLPPDVTVVAVRGADHSLRQAPAAVADAVAGWLAGQRLT